MEDKRYTIYSQYLKKKYGEKVYKLPVNLPVTCPNRDGTVGEGGCVFCGDEAAGFEMLSDTLSIKQQIQQNMQYIGQKYNANKFIVYFQNFTNTYMPLEMFEKCMAQACVPKAVEIAISTRPDCISEPYLVFLSKLQADRGIQISIELGLQTVNYHSLYKINRGHTLAEFIDAVRRIQRYQFDICTHLIMDLPWDNLIDVIESAKLLSALEINQVKLHSLYIVKGTRLGEWHEKQAFKPVKMDEYIKRVVTFLEYLHPNIAVQRLIGRAPKEETVFVNWHTSWWKIRDEIERTLEQRDTYQGEKCDYLNGKAVAKYR